MTDYGQQVRAARLQRGWTQQHLAQLCRQHHTAISRLESGARAPRAESRLALAIEYRLGVEAPLPAVRPYVEKPRRTKPLVNDRPGFDGPIEEHLKLVEWVLSTRVPAWVFLVHDRDDLRQAGVEGLLAAKRLYDPARGAWSTFSSAKVRWAILIAAGLTRHGWEQRPVPLPERFGEVNVADRGAA